jgi:hypothetical protein
MRVPLSKIKSGLYTQGGEYVDKKTQKPYKGYYYKLYGKFYAGKTYDSNATPVEIEVKKKAINNPNSFIYNVLAGAQQAVSNPVAIRPTKQQNLASIQAANKQGFVPVIGVNLDADENALQSNANEIQKSSTPVEVKRYFFRKKISIIPIGYKIGEVDEDEWNRIKQQLNTYTTAIVTETRIEGMQPQLNTDELDKAERKIPGLKRFLGITNEE